MKLAAASAVLCALALPQSGGRVYLVKLSVPVSTSQSKPGDPIRAAIISPESLLSGYLEGTVQEVASQPSARLVLRFDKLRHKDKSTPIALEVIDFVNSKNHKAMDDNERPLTLKDGAFTARSGDIWLDEGAELRLRAASAQTR